MISAVTEAARPSTIPVAETRPDNVPLITTFSASMVPVTVPPSPIVTRRATILPEWWPRIWTSPSLTMSPSSLRPALRIDGTERRFSFPTKAWPAGLVCARLNHIFASLQELLGVDRSAVETNFVMEMGAGAAAGAAQLGDPHMRCNVLAIRHQNSMKMGIERYNAVTVVDFDRAAVTFFPAREDDDARRGAKDRRAVRRVEIDAGVEFRASVEWVGPRAEWAANSVTHIKRRTQRQNLRNLQQSGDALLFGRIAAHAVERNERAAHCGLGLLTDVADDLVEIDAGRGQNLLKPARRMMRDAAILKLRDRLHRRVERSALADRVRIDRAMLARQSFQRIVGGLRRGSRRSRRRNGADLFAWLRQLSPQPCKLLVLAVGDGFQKIGARRQRLHRVFKLPRVSRLGRASLFGPLQLGVQVIDRFLQLRDVAAVGRQLLLRRGELLLQILLRRRGRLSRLAGDHRVVILLERGVLPVDGGELLIERGDGLRFGVGLRRRGGLRRGRRVGRDGGGAIDFAIEREIADRQIARATKRADTGDNDHRLQPTGQQHRTDAFRRAH